MVLLKIISTLRSIMTISKHLQLTKDQASFHFDVLPQRIQIAGHVIYIMFVFMTFRGNCTKILQGRVFFMVLLSLSLGHISACYLLWKLSLFFLVLWFVELKITMAMQANPQNLKPDEFFNQNWAHLSVGINKNLTAFATKIGMAPKEWWTYHE